MEDLRQRFSDLVEPTDFQCTATDHSFRRRSSALPASLGV